MGFSDLIFEAYLKIYDGIKDYSDYCECQKKNTIDAMISLQKIIYSFNQLDSGEQLNDTVIEGIIINCEHDYAKSILGLEYDDDVDDIDDDD